MSDRCRTRGAVLFAASGVGTTFVVTPDLREPFRRYVDEGWDIKNQRRIRGEALDRQGFFTDLDVFTEEEMQEDPTYRDFFWKEGFGWGVGTFIENANGDRAFLAFEGARERGPVEREIVDWLDMLRPHLARSLAMAVRVRQQLATTVAQSLEALGLPSCVLDDRGRMIAANQPMQKLIPSIVADGRNRVYLHHQSSDRLLEDALRNKAPQVGRGPVLSIPVPASEKEPACVVHLLHVRGDGYDIVPGGLFVLVVAVLAAQAVPDAAMLRALFDLTPAEARVARLVATGVKPRDVHLQAQIMPNTAKSHLKSIYLKTGVSHQGGLVRLLSGTSFAERES